MLSPWRTPCVDVDRLCDSCTMRRTFICIAFHRTLLVTKHRYRGAQRIFEADENELCDPVDVEVRTRLLFMVGHHDHVNQPCGLYACDPALR
jgi:hypothetical protein